MADEESQESSERKRRRSESDEVKEREDQERKDMIEALVHMNWTDDSAGLGYFRSSLY